MLSRLSLLLSVLFLFSASNADAFMFDNWKSGMKIKSVIEAGNKKGASVDLASGEFSFFGKREPEATEVSSDAVLNIQSDELNASGRESGSINHSS